MVAAVSVDPETNIDQGSKKGALHYLDSLNVIGES
jgi:hypothetical protein